MFAGLRIHETLVAEIVGFNACRGWKCVRNIILVYRDGMGGTMGWFELEQYSKETTICPT
jgi:hypothetical protein